MREYRSCFLILSSLERFWNAHSPKISPGGSTLNKTLKTTSEYVFCIHLKSPQNGQKGHLVLESSNPEQKVRFDDLDGLMRYLQAFTRPNEARGLR